MQRSTVTLRYETVTLSAEEFAEVLGVSGDALQVSIEALAETHRVDDLHAITVTAETRVTSAPEGKS